MEYYTVSQLRKMCRDKNISIKSSMKKRELYELCTNPCDNVTSKKSAAKCVDYLNQKYPKTVYKFCRPIVKGPAAALIQENTQVIGIITPRGIVKPLDCPIPVPPPQPLPIVKINKTSPIKREIVKNKGKKIVVNYDKVVDQIAAGKSKLRKVSQQELDEYKNHKKTACELSRSKTLLGEIEARKCEYGFVWNNKLKRCIAVKSGTSPTYVSKKIEEYYQQ